ncbi:hypothetical protein DM860_003629 [Cuscuta australis]|uniref:BAG domain-containing protein n=1 Tax=Cuscuta australis TaxID=267555 RepID=A0A328DI54_9ASTE|nr:hypothetical protein DM860_003629 [Cuscuta australis]
MTGCAQTFRNEHSAPRSERNSFRVPIQSPSDDDQEQERTTAATTASNEIAAAAVKIQSAYRSHVVRMLVRKISAVYHEAAYLQCVIQRQALLNERASVAEAETKLSHGQIFDTVDAVRSNERERIRMNEDLMGLLLRLDSVPGVDPAVRDLRRNVSRKIVGLQEILDAVSAANIETWDGFLRDWDEDLVKIETDACNGNGNGNGDIERFCAQYLGFRCLQQFLHDQW